MICLGQSEATIRVTISLVSRWTHLTSDTSDALLTLLSLLSVGDRGRSGDTEEEEVGHRGISPTWRETHT